MEWRNDRAALTIYEDSDGKVLLLAAVKIVADSYGGGGGGGEGGGYYRQYGGGVRGGWADHIQVEVLPTGKTFRFTESCHLLVLAETKQSAEEWIFDIQVGDGEFLKSVNSWELLLLLLANCFLMEVLVCDDGDLMFWGVVVLFVSRRHQSREYLKCIYIYI